MPDKTRLSFTLNGRTQAVVAEPFVSLADTLREGLGLTGTKVGCEAGDCGACTVLMNGRQVCACLVPSVQADGTEIHTVEGAGPDGVTDTLRRAFLAHGAAQCGICTPGMLMAATDLLVRTPAPSRGDIEDALGGVLCRCTGYIKIIEAVADVAAGSTLTAPLADAGAAVGARIARVDGFPKVAGTDRFGADDAPADALWMRIVRSPHARARFTLGDLDGLKARVRNIAFINDRVANVRFTRTVQTETDQQSSDWIATVTFRYTNAPMAEGDRYRNPLGFQVENYRADPEVVR